MKAKIRKFQSGLANISLLIAAIMVASVAAAIFANVVGRFVLHIGLMWVELYARYMLIWSVFVAANVLIQRNELIRVDFLDSMWPKKFLQVREILYTALFLFILAIMVTQGWKQAVNYIGVVAQGLPIDKFWVYLCVPVGAVLMLIQYLANLIVSFIDWKEARKG